MRKLTIKKIIFSAKKFLTYLSLFKKKKKNNLKKATVTKMGKYCFESNRLFGFLHKKKQQTKNKNLKKFNGMLIYFHFSPIRMFRKRIRRP